MGNGGIIGPDNVPTFSLASGVWTINEVADAVREGIWPRESLPLLLGADLWLDASDVTTITESGGSVSAWGDKSGNTRNFSQGTSGNRPTTGTRTLNGLNVIDFDGSDDFMTGGDVLDLLTNGVTMFVVTKLDVASGVKGIAGKSRAAANAGRYSFLYDSTFTALFEDTAGRSATNTPSVQTNPYVWAMRVIRNSQLRLWRDGSVVATTTGLSGTTSYNTTDIWMVGAYQSTTGGTPPLSGSFMDGYIAEVVVFVRDLSDAEVDEMNTYLRSKWGL
jgi:hypothetical protein